MVISSTLAILDPCNPKLANALPQALVCAFSIADVLFTPTAHFRQAVSNYKAILTVMIARANTRRSLSSRISVAILQSVPACFQLQLAVQP